MHINKQIVSIVTLCVSAGLLLAYVASPPARGGDLVIKDRDYQIVTGHAINGGDDLYILDNRTGLMAVFVFDPNRHGVFPRAFTSVVDLFANPRR
jgi:hypothetical protein